MNAERPAAAYRRPTIWRIFAVNTNKPNCMPGMMYLRCDFGRRLNERNSANRMGEKNKQETNNRNVLKTAGGNAMGIMYINLAQMTKDAHRMGTKHRITCAEILNLKDPNRKLLNDEGDAVVDAVAAEEEEEDAGGSK